MSSEREHLRDGGSQRVAQQQPNEFRRGAACSIGAKREQCEFVFRQTLHGRSASGFAAVKEGGA